jgi:ABC-type Fe3+ transport system substrate-binding protein
MRRITRNVLALFALGLYLPGSLAFAAELGPAQKGEWERTLEEARREAQVGVSGSDTFELFLRREFANRFPDIRVNYAGGRGPIIGPRILMERRAGKYLIDVVLSGPGTPYRVLHRAKVLDPIGPALILPEVLDRSKWFQGRHHYVDAEEKYIFIYEATVQSGDIAYNTERVNPREIKSYWDLLSPKWKGKIVSMDPRVSGAVSRGVRFFYFQPQLGPSFLRRLFGEADIALSRDFTQMIDWLATGKFLVGVFAGSSETAKAAEQGLAVREFSPGHFTEGAAVSPFNGTVSLMNRAPHPHAAKVLINWLLSRDGQAAVQRHMAGEGNIRESLREDIPKDVIPAAHRRQPGVQYLMISRAVDIDMEREALKLVQDALAEAQKR